MLNDEALKRIEQLEQIYERNWGRKVDLTIRPAGLSQEKLVLVLERIVETGESVLVGWDKIFNS